MTKEVNRRIDHHATRQVPVNEVSAKILVDDAKLLNRRKIELAALQRESRFLSMALGIVNAQRQIIRDQLSDLRDYDASFDLYWKATNRAAELWRDENPQQRGNILPDTGMLVDWLIERGNNAVQR